MAMAASDIKEWLDTLGEDVAVGIDDGGLCLLSVDDPDIYLEIGGMPDSDGNDACLSEDGQELPMEAAIDILAGGPRASMCWNYRHQGEHPEHPLSDWKHDVGNGDTVLGYQDWVIHNLEARS